MDAPVAGGSPVIAAHQLEKTFPDGTRALAPIDLQVAPREFVTLLGPSGCGKSTLLRALAGLDRLSAGRVEWWGGDAPLGGAGRKLMFVFQDATLMPWARVRANVRLPLDLSGAARDDAEARVDAALALVGLSHFGRHYPRQLSGGMQMRTSLARALVTEPDLLLLDEPFGALDEITRNKLDAELLALYLQKHLTVVFVTHSIYEAVFLSSKVVVMSPRPGRILHEVAIAEPYPRTDDFRVTQRFSDYARQLAACLAEASAGAPEESRR